MVDVVLVQPKVAIQDELQDRPTLPLSLMMAASLVCRERSVSLIDQRVTPGWEQELRNAVRSGPVCVGVTAMTGPQIMRALEVADIVRDEDPEIPVVWGGPHATLDPDGTVRHPLVDAVVIGDGEVTLWEYVRALEDGSDLGNVHGLAHLRNGKVRIAPRRPNIGLDELPDPPFHLLDAERYVFKRRGRRCMNLSTVRGCPHQCTFCYSPVECHGRWRALSAARTLDLTESVVERYRLGFVWYMEQNSLVDRERALAIGKGLLDRGLDVLWEAEAHVSSIKRLTDEDLALLARSGLSDVVIGVESGSQHMVDLLQKGIRVDDVVALNRRLARYPFNPRFSFMCGFPGETEEMLHATLSLIVGLHRDNPLTSTSCLNPAIPFPGTPYLELAMRHGLEPPTDLAGWAAYTPHEALAQGLDTLLPWIDLERADLLRRLYVASSFMDDKSVYVEGRILQLLSRAYRPIAKARLASGNTEMMELEDALYWEGRELVSGRRRAAR